MTMAAYEARRNDLEGRAHAMPHNQALDFLAHRAAAAEAKLIDCRQRLVRCRQALSDIHNPEKGE